MTKLSAQQDRPAFQLLLPPIIGAVLALGILNLLSGSIADKNFDELALGEGTSSYPTKAEGMAIHGHDIKDAVQFIEEYKKVTGDEVILWLGNSQLHAINQIKKGDEPASFVLHRNLRSAGKYSMTFSQPNANLQEHYVLFEYLASHLPVTTLVLPVVCDDMRETRIRPGLQEAFQNNEVVKQLKRTDIGKQLIMCAQKQDLAGNDMTALKDTLQEKSEIYLNTTLERTWKIWASRPELRGHLFGLLYEFRNWAFNINASSVRRVIPGRNKLNQQAFEAILISARGKGIDVLVYNVPIRSDVQIPYDLDEYVDFKKQVESVSVRQGAQYINLENLVPPKYWGSKNSTGLKGGQELDFMHFQGAGHQLLAEALHAELQNLWSRGKNKK